MDVRRQPKKVLVHRPGKLPYFSTRYVLAPSAGSLATKKIRVIPSSQYSGNLSALYLKWLQIANSDKENFKQLVVSVIALQEILTKKYIGFLAVLGETVVGVLSLERIGNELRVSVIAPSPDYLLSGQGGSVQTLLAKIAKDYAEQRGLSLKDLPEHLEKGFLNQLQNWIEKQRARLVPKKVQVHREGKTFQAIRWVNPEAGQTKTASGLPIPPAWTNVKVNPDPKAALQAIGHDAKGRTQYLYSQAHSQKQAAAKFKRLEAFNKELPKMRQKIQKDLNSSQEAQILYLIDQTAFRIGSDRETQAAQKAYGISTLLGRHVTVTGNKIEFDFVGKKGVRIQKTIEDPVAAKIIRQHKTGVDQQLFSVTEKDVRKYIYGLTKKHFLIKDFRTWHGTNLALQEVAKHPVPTTKREFQKARKAVAEVVSKWLGNTPGVALASYIQPEIFREWEVAIASQK